MPRYALVVFVMDTTSVRLWRYVRTCPGRRHPWPRRVASCVTVTSSRPLPRRCRSSPLRGSGAGRLATGLRRDVVSVGSARRGTTVTVCCEHLAVPRVHDRWERWSSWRAIRRVGSPLSSRSAASRAGQLREPTPGQSRERPHSDPVQCAFESRSGYACPVGPAGSGRRPVTAEITGSNPVRDAWESWPRGKAAAC